MRHREHGASKTITIPTEHEDNSDHKSQGQIETLHIALACQCIQWLFSLEYVSVQKTTLISAYKSNYSSHL